MRHLGVYRRPQRRGPRPAEHRPLDQVEPILRRLADEKRAIVGSGPPEKKRYRLMPLMPGMFEMILVALAGFADRLAPPFRRVVRGALRDRLHGRLSGPADALVRFLPVGKAIEAHPLALPSDQFEVVLDQFDAFGVGQCQCRIASRGRSAAAATSRRGTAP